MDSLFDSSIIKLIIPIILFILFSLPDLLRKKRKYPSNKKRKEAERKQREQEQRPTDVVASSTTAETEDLPDIAKPRSEPPPTPVTTIPEPEPAPEPTPVVTIPKPVKQPSVVLPQVALSRPLHAAQTAPHEPWAQLSPEGRDIYAGLIWSELLEPPLALRKKRR